MEKPSILQSFILFIARICIAGIFIVAGINKIMDFNGNLAYMTSHHVPYTQLLLIIAIICELGGGILLLIGWLTRFGALLLILFVLGVTFIFHTFWNFEAAQAVGQMQHFLKNFSIIGGLLYVLAMGAGCISFDACRHCKRK